MIFTIYSAIEEMRKLTRKKISFSMSFMSYSESKQDSHGVVEVANAKLGKSDKVEHNRNADIMLNYIDKDSGEQHRFYYPLLMLFNGQAVELT